MRIVVLGAGFGGLELTAKVSEALGDDTDIVLIDKKDHFVFGFSKLDVMFGKTTSDAVKHRYADVVRPGVQLVQASIEAIEPTAKRVVTSAGVFEGDVLVVALGADLEPGATPGLVEGGHEFYTNEGAFQLRDVIADFPGGRVVVGVTSTPFKCPPAPSETVLMMHDFLTERGLREQSSIDLVMPLPRPIPPSPEASAFLLTTFAEKGIGWHPDSLVAGLDPDRKVVEIADGREIPYDLFLGVPVHRVPAVVAESGMTVDGWVPVNPYTLETSYPDVYAVGDVTSVGTPKAGTFSERQAIVVADRLIAQARAEAAGAEYDGVGVCYLDMGDGTVAHVEVTFKPGELPAGSWQVPTAEAHELKVQFGSTRIKRWFNQDWTPTA
jgi:sulfide:quinone oxidoreductase